VTDIQQELDLTNQDLDTVVQTISAKEHFWAQLSLEAKLDADTFEKTDYADFYGHHDAYARWYMKAVGERAPFTNTAKENTVRRLFADDLTDESRHTYAQTAYLGYEKECQAVGLNPRSMVNFSEDMYVYEISPKEVELKMAGLKHGAAQLQTIAAGFGNLSWTVKSLAADRRALSKNDII
jgi:hypothetical protein